MESHILKTAARHLVLPFMIVSLSVLWRGHNLPGGGFVGGLIAAAAFILYNVAFGVQEAKKLLRIETKARTALGLLIAMSSAMLSLLFHKPLMTGLWVDVALPLVGHQHFGTPQLFDAGVYLGVFGVVLTLVVALSEES